jgi:hypothetical protein
VTSTHQFEVSRGLLLNAGHMPLFLYPFLNTNSKDRAFEYLRLTSLGVIGALVKVCLVISLSVVSLFCGVAAPAPLRTLGAQHTHATRAHVDGRNRGHLVFATDRDHPAVSADHGDGKRALQDCRDLHRAEDSA